MIAADFANSLIEATVAMHEIGHLLGQTHAAGVQLAAAEPSPVVGNQRRARRTVNGGDEVLPDRQIIAAAGFE